jgi:hypothetical protein
MEKEWHHLPAKTNNFVIFSYFEKMKSCQINYLYGLRINKWIIKLVKIIYIWKISFNHGRIDFPIYH